jgi:uncharacterized protein (AIM24 family)
MATFEVQHTEGMRWVRVELADDDVRTERGALNHMQGAITMDVPLPSLRAAWVSLFSDESVLRPRYRGTGTVFLDSSLGSYHRLEIRRGEKWILDRRCFWASDGEVEITVRREHWLTSLYAGEGFVWYKTALAGEGQAMLSVDGPIKEIHLSDDRLVVDGPQVVARTTGVRFSLRRPTANLLSFWLSGENRSSVYEGSGRLLICTTPYWRLRMQRDRLGAAAE